MQRLLCIILFALIFVIGCSESDPPVVDTFRGNPIDGEIEGILTLEGSPYLVVDTLRVAEGKVLTIDPGVEIRFDLIVDEGIEKAIPFEVFGTLIAVGTPESPIVFTSGLKRPTRGDWDGIWLIDAEDASRFEYCKFMFGAKYGRRYRYRVIGSQLDSLLFDYGSLTLFRSSPVVRRCWFIFGGFHGVQCDSSSNPTMENNIFYDNAGHGVLVHWTADPILRYNIISENDDYGVFCREEGESPNPRADLNLDYNIVWSNFSGEFNTETAPRSLGRISQTNENLDSCDYRFNLRLDPAFKNTKLSRPLDFNLSPWSAAIDAGPEDPENTDPDGTRIELGIYSYTYRPGELRRRITVDRLKLDSSPYIMSCDALLQNNQTLIIEPGVEIRVEGRFKFEIRGQLLSQGTVSNHVILRSADDNAAPGSWLGLIFEPGGSQSTVLSYTDILDARWGMYFSQRDAMVDHCTIANTDSVGILCHNFSTPTIVNCRFERNAVAAILCQYNSSPVIRRNTILRGAGYGIYARQSSRPLIENNVIMYNAVDAIRLEYLSSAVIVNNTIALNGYFGMNCVSNSSPDVRNNIFYRNGDVLRGGIGVLAVKFSRPVIEYNSFWDHYKSAVSISKDTTALDNNLNYMVDPMFVDLEGLDMRLKPGSPCRETGDPSLNNPDGTRSDLGAYGGPWAIQ